MSQTYIVNKKPFLATSTGDAINQYLASLKLDDDKDMPCPLSANLASESKDARFVNYDGRA